MTRQGFVLLTILLFSAAMLAQHASGGGGGGHSGGSSGGGGGSHGGSSGGGSSSAGSSSHSSGGSSGGSHSHSGSPGKSASSGSSSRGSGGSAAHGSEAVKAGTRGEFNSTSDKRQVGERPPKRGFFGFLRHHPRKPEPKPVANLWPKRCWNGHCRVCPPGFGGGRGGCAAPNLALLLRDQNVCSHLQVWSGNPCLQQAYFMDDCSALRASLDRQARRMQEAESARQSKCSTGAAQECVDLTTTSQSESNLYRSLEERYRQCRLGAWRNYSSTGPAGMSSPLPLFDPLQMDLDDH